eukprot:CAMPEP_0185350108 /NCGR_PEP_ID=MMETSP1364-20130426/2669_2 /TAXON_ID=38817 /ORGANISM="Gephyrocapsa oceanica, Strain RCC1303" /LENGTH=83 /DNA_ID=CAMNT_0027949607 /DNA_START=160 /DNA_END=411 /DNA_ORIENTATION=-
MSLSTCIRHARPTAELAARARARRRAAPELSSRVPVVVPVDPRLAAEQGLELGLDLLWLVDAGLQQVLPEALPLVDGDLRVIV